MAYTRARSILMTLLFSGLLYTNALDCDQQALGMESGKIKDDQLEVINSLTEANLACTRPGKECTWCTKKEMSAYFEIKFRKPHEVHAVKLFPTKMTQVEQFFMIATDAETGRKTPIREKTGMATKFNGPTDTEARKILLSPIKVNSIQFRFHSSKVDPCFKFELYGCRAVDVCIPKCQNGGKCVQDMNEPDENTCECPKGFAGPRCELSAANVKVEAYEFTEDSIKTHDSILKKGKLGETLLLNGVNSYAVIGNIAENSCIRNPTVCVNGLTLHLWINLDDVKNGANLLSSNGNRDQVTGLDLLYQNNKLVFNVAETKALHTATAELKKRDEWVMLDLSFHPKSGATIIIDKKLVSAASVKKDVNLQVAPKAELTFGFNKETGVELRAEIEDVKAWPASNDALVALNMINNFPVIDEVKVKAVLPRDPDTPTEFVCQAPEIKDRNFVVKVEWQLNGRTIKPSQDLPKDKQEHEIGNLLEWEIVPPLKANDKLTCSIKTCYAEVCDIDDMISPPKTSQPFIPELKIVYPDTLTLVEGEVGQRIRITTNLPPHFFCDCDMCDFDCQIRFNAEIVGVPHDLRCPDGSHVSQAVVRWDGGDLRKSFCGVTINRLTFNDAQDIWIKAKLDGKCDGDQTRTLRLHQECYCGEKKISTKLIKQDNILIKDRDRCSGGECHSNNDPHMRSFDLRHYEFHETGEFVLYRNLKNNDQVNIFYNKCSPGHWVACNCGVAIKVDDNVLVIDRCGPHKENHNGEQRIKFLSFLNSELSPRVRLFRNGYTYQVILASGTIITVSQQGNPFLNVQVTPSPSDWESTEGLCGPINGNQADDFRMRNGAISNDPTVFGKSWTVPTHESLFWGVCPENKKNLDDANQVHCQCPSAVDQKCAVGMDKWHCTGTGVGAGQDITTETFVQNPANQRKAQCKDQKRRKRTTEYDESNQVFHRIDKRQAAMSAQEARTICNQEILNTPAARTCANFFKDNDFNALVKNCETDLVATGDKAWALVGLENLRQECLSKAIADVSKWQPDEKGQLQPPAQLTAALCEKSCSGRGVCTKGACQCNAGFGGSDCSIDSKALVASLEILQAERFCQLEHGTHRCNSVRIYGKSFMNTPQAPKCRLTSGMMTIDGKFQLAPPLQQVVVNAKYLNFDSIVCEIPATMRGAAIQIEVANSGPWSSETVVYVPYDTACQNCAPTGCTIKKDTCFVVNKCFDKFELHENNKNEICDPSLSQIKFSPVNQKYFEIVSSEAVNGFIDVKLKVLQPIKTVCSCGESKKCILNIRADLPEKDSFIKNIFNQKFLTQVVAENSCNAEVNANSLEAKLRVRIAQSHLLDNGGLLKLKLWSQCHLDSGTVDRMEEIIHVKKPAETRQDQCSLTFDSQMTTFSKQQFNFNAEGEFLFYRHEDKSQEVTVFRRRCSKTYHSACTCAVAARIADDVFLFDRCGEFGGKMSINIELKSYVNGDLTEGTHLLSHWDGRKYEVIFPSGARLLILAADSGYLNTFLFSSATESLESSAGMCNSKNGLKSIEVASSASLYSGVCAQQYPAGKVFCTCSGRQNSICASNADSQSIYPNQIAQNIAANIDVLRSSGKAVKCGTGGFLVTNDPVPKEPSWPTSSGLTQNKVSEACRKGLKESALYQICNQIFGLQADVMVEHCVRAVQLRDNLRVVDDALEVYREECRQAALRSVQHYKYDFLDHRVVINPEVLTQLCPNACSGSGGSGTCHLGECKCGKSYAGVDCSQRSDWEPEVMGLENGGAIAPLGKVLVRTKRLASALKPVCEIKKRDPIGRTIGNFEIATTVYLTSDALICYLNGADSGLLRVRYAATNALSTEVPFITQKTLCQTCHAGKGFCQIKEGYCYIENNCYADGQLDKINPSRGCVSQKSKHSWTETGPDLTKCGTAATKGFNYIGTQTKTAGGYTCQRWDVDKPHTVFHVYKNPKVYPDKSIAAAENYCRNPDFSEPKPWCYTTDPDKRWDFCDIPLC